jgi:restriction system protein
MKAWVVRAGSTGENEGLALDSGIVTVGWSETGDLAGVGRDEIRRILESQHPDASVKRLAVWTGELWSFVNSIEVGDLAVLPLKSRSAIAIGRVAGGYEFRPELIDRDAVHTHRVNWLKTDVPRTGLDRSLLNTLGSTLTVFRAEKNNAVALLESAAIGLESSTSANGEIETVITPDEALDIDFARRARDEVVSMIRQKFRGHDLERLVEAVLLAQGFRVSRTRRGADGGVDLLAGKGIYGFDHPRICVQVKSGKQPEDVKPIRELQGALKNFGADQALFVSWSGYTDAVYAESRRSFFQVRLWDADELVDAVLENYDQLGADIRAELPLKKIWVPTLQSGLED